MVPARSWDHHLERTLETLARLRLPPEVEVEVVVGLAGAPPAAAPAGVRVVPNPSGTIPDALNLAIAASRGEVVVRVDARCEVAPDHVARVLAVLDDPTIGCVGGAQLVLDRGVFGSAYAIAFNSALLGPSPYRYSRRSGPTDTAYLGAWRRADLLAVGGFDPRLLRNQDNELADRIRGSGKVVWYDADLVVGYHNARSLVGALAHHRDFGLWRMLQSGDGQRGFTRTHVAAVAAVAAATAGGVAALASPRTRPLVVGLGCVGYALAATAARRTAGRLRRARPDIAGPDFHPLGVLAAPAVAVLVDAAWGAGVAQGIVRPPRGGLDPGHPHDPGGR